MAIKTETSPNLIEVPGLRRIEIKDVNILARLTDVAYQGTIDHEGESLDQCADEMRETITGKYGEFVSEASQLIIRDGKAVSACLITMWKNRPLVAFTMTDPAYQRQGLSQHLMKASLQALAKIDEPILYLVVTEGNLSAQNLYRKLGFKDLGIAQRGQPPPDWT
jgi:GNAT superfamily N-acetyltransferase